MCNMFQLGPLTNGNLTDLDRHVLFRDNIDLVIKRVCVLHNRKYKETDFDMVSIISILRLCINSRSMFNNTYF